MGLCLLWGRPRWRGAACPGAPVSPPRAGWACACLRGLAPGTASPGAAFWGGGRSLGAGVGRGKRRVVPAGAAGGKRLPRRGASVDGALAWRAGEPCPEAAPAPGMLLRQICLGDPPASPRGAAGLGTRREQPGCHRSPHQDPTRRRVRGGCGCRGSLRPLQGPRGHSERSRVYLDSFLPLDP